MKSVILHPHKISRTKGLRHHPQSKSVRAREGIAGNLMEMSKPLTSSTPLTMADLCTSVDEQRKDRE